MATTAPRKAERPSPLLASPGSAHHAVTSPLPVTLEDVALQLFSLLHSPPLSLATLVRADLLHEVADSDGHRRLVVPSSSSGGHAHSPTTRSSAAIPPMEEPFAATQASHPQQHQQQHYYSPPPPLASPVSSAAPAVHQSQHTPHDGPSAADHTRQQADGAASTGGWPATATAAAAAAPSLASPSSQSTRAASPSALRIARVASDVVASRLADLYAHHPPYALREWLHREAIRLSCPTYQDPVSNDLIATAETLRQREALVTAYVRLYEQQSHTLPSAEPSMALYGDDAKDDGGDGTGWRGGRRTEPKDVAVAAWSRSLHALLGCHHQRERHCPHRTLDEYGRTREAAGTHNSPPGTAAVNGNTSKKTEGRSAKQRGQRPATAQEMSVALRFVQQMLHSTPLPLHKKREGNDGVQQPGNTTVDTTNSVNMPPTPTTTAAVGVKTAHASEFDTAAVPSAMAGATVTFVRSPSAAVKRSATTTSFSTSAAVEGRREKEENERGERGKEEEISAQRTVPPATSLDCMIGVEDGESADAATTSSYGSPTGAQDGYPQADGVDVPAVPPRRGPRIQLRRPASTTAAAGAAAAGKKPKRGGRHPSSQRPSPIATGSPDVPDATEMNDRDDVDASLRATVAVAHGESDAVVSRQHRQHDSTGSRTSSSRSSSVSLSVVGDEGDDELALMEDDVVAGEGDEYEYEEEEDEEEEDGDEVTVLGEKAGAAVAQDSVDGARTVVDAAFDTATHVSQTQSTDTTSRLTVRAISEKAGMATAAGGDEKATAAPPSFMADPGQRRSRRHVSQYPAATNTTADFLASRNGGLFSAASLTNPAAAVAAAAGLGNAASPPSSSFLPSPPHSPRDGTGQLNGVAAAVSAGPSAPLLAGYTLTRPFSLSELPPAEAAAVLQLPFYAQAHEINRLACVRGRSCYQDPYTHCLLLTSRFLESLPHCYGEYCKHCPHGEVCQRRQLQPQASRAARRRHHRSHHRGQEYRGGGGGGSGSDSGSLSGSDSSSGDDVADDEDDPAMLRFLAALDAADNSEATVTHTVKESAGGEGVTVADAEMPASPTHGVSPAWGAAALRPYSSRPASADASSAVSSSSSAASSSASSFSDGEGDHDEQHRHHVLRSATMTLVHGQPLPTNGAGVVVQVDTLRDLLLWGHHPLVGIDHAGGDGVGVGGGEEEEKVAMAAAAASRDGSATVAADAPGRTAVVGGVESLEELLRRHEASLERFTYLDSSAL